MSTTEAGLPDLGAIDLEANDPYPHYRVLRDLAPLYEVPDRKWFVLSRYDDCRAATLDAATFSSVMVPPDKSRRSAASDGYVAFLNQTSTVISSDPPVHTRLRRIVSREFTPRAIGRWEPQVRVVVDELWQELEESDRTGQADFVRDVAVPLPIRIIAEVMGVDEEGRANFKRWTDEMMAWLSFDPAVRSRATTDAWLATDEYFRAQIADRRRAPRNDLISLFVSAADRDDNDDAPLSDDELVAHCQLFLVGGNETTTNLLSNGICALAAHPEQWALVCEDRSRIPGTIEEMLRYDGTTNGQFRRVTTDVELHGVRMPAGSQVQLLFRSANRDERHFERPDEFDIRRQPNDHLGLGGGMHFCIGAALARLQIGVVLENLAVRAPGFSITGPTPADINIITRGRTSVPIALGGSIPIA